ncbi:50S ribosomal protein L4 [bacterium BMS3Abin01]|nr:50S ribosomal protein L4 [bacterium BMS3Abin01]HDZ59578.1 50S ribosomal protein L4 [Actinomycetota bacterium]
MAETDKKEKAPENGTGGVKALAGKDYKLNPDVFEVEFKVGVVHEVVRAEQAADRKGTASTKTRGQVRGGGVKPWRQKGTGRARAGSSRMPHWTGGGVAFGPSPRDYSFKVNRKVRRKAVKMVLSERAREGALKVVESLAFDEPKTAAANAALEKLDVSYPLLVLTDESDANAELSFRNLPEVGVRQVDGLAVTEVMGARTLLVSRPALEQLNKLGEAK